MELMKTNKCFLKWEIVKQVNKSWEKKYVWWIEGFWKKRNEMTEWRKSEWVEEGMDGWKEGRADVISPVDDIARALCNNSEQQ